MRSGVRTLAMVISVALVLTTSGVAAAAQVPIRIFDSGKNVKEINGFFELLPEGRWREVNQEGSDIFRVNEQSVEVIELVSVTRGILLRLDIAKKQVLYAKDAAEKFRFLYKITDVIYGDPLPAMVTASPKSAPRTPVYGPTMEVVSPVSVEVPE